MIGLATLWRHYVIARWKAMAVSTLASIAVTGLNAASLALFAAVPQLILLVMRDPTAAPPPAPAAFSIPGSVQGAVEAIGALVGHMHATFGATASMMILLGAYLAASVLARLVQLLADMVIVVSRNRAAIHMTKDVFRHFLALSLDFFHGRRTGDMVMRVRNDVPGLALASFETVHTAVSTLPLFVFYWGLLFLIDWRLTVAVVGLYAVKTAVADRLGRKLKPVIARLGFDIGRTAAKLTEVFTNIAVVKAFGGEPSEHTRFGLMVETHYRNNIKRRLFELVNGAVQNVLQSVALVTIAVVGLMMLVEKTIEPVTLLVFLFAAIRGQEPSRKLMSVVVLFRQAQGTAVRVLEVLRHAPAVVDGPRQAPGYASSLVLDGVSYTYPSRAGDGSGRIDDVALSIRRGEVVAIVGPSGAGKSSVLSVLLRFCDPDRGRVLLDGDDIREFTQRSYRRLFGVVSQEPFLFHASVRDNIAYGDLGAEVSDERLFAAAQIAHVHEFAEKLPHGYDTLIGDRGVQLSGGQKQRVALARAILRNPPILVLDEATSSLDSDSERLIQDAIDRFLQGRTAVIVAHRLSTIRRANRIVVMDQGRIVEEGTHEELMKRGGHYRHLYNSQFGMAAAPASEGSEPAAIQGRPRLQTTGIG